MSVAARPQLLGGGQAVHGSPDYREIERLGIDPDSVLDFSVNSNAYGPSPSVHAALAAVVVDRYPDNEGGRLRRALADEHAVLAKHVLLGNGAAELIWLVAAAFVRAGDGVAVLAPTFAEYERASQAFGAVVQPLRALAEDGFAPRLAFICNPNNPTGRLLPVDLIDSWCRTHTGTLFVVDEAYLPFTAGAPSAVALGHDNLLVLRSMTKDCALAGLRLGYAVGSPAVVAALEAVRPPWSVNAMAQVAGLAALADREHTARTLQSLRLAKADLLAGLAHLGLAPLPSSVHYFLVDVGDGAAFRRRLLQQAILVRDCASFGLPRHVRIATRRPEENRRLLDAIERQAP